MSLGHTGNKCNGSGHKEGGEFGQAFLCNRNVSISTSEGIDNSLAVGIVQEFEQMLNILYEFDTYSSRWKRDAYVLLNSVCLNLFRLPQYKGKSLYLYSRR